MLQYLIRLITTRTRDISSMKLMFRRSCFSTGVLFLFTLISTLPGLEGLDCFKCDSVWSLRECMQKDPETCGFGQICSNTVSVGGYVGKKYTKGCMDDDLCYSLQTLNHRVLCDREPAICVYCCEDELCNTAMTSLPVGALLYVLTSSIAVIIFSSL